MRVVSRVVVDEVTRLFGATPALRGVSCAFEAGSITSLEGPNGAGKSTLLAILGTALRATSGSVVYQPFGSDVEAVRAHVGWLAHEAHCYGDLSGRENVALAARLRGHDDDACVDAACQRAGAEPFADRRVGALSRGQKQRVSLARAIVHRPSVLLLDEPTTGLDAMSVERLERVVSEESEAGAIVVLVTHDAGLADRVGARRVRLERGRIAAG